MRYFLHIAIGLNQLGTTILGGWPDETLSSYAYRLDIQGKPAGRLFRPVIDWLFSWQGLEHGHCFTATQEERLRFQLPPELR
jgi:hypothetical protein